MNHRRCILFVAAWTAVLVAGGNVVWCGQPENSDQDLAKLIAHLKDEKPETRVQAVIQLGKMGEKAASAVPDLIPLLDDAAVAGGFMAPSIGERVVYTLRFIGSPAVPAVAKALRNPNAEIRAKAAKVLADIARFGDHPPLAKDVLPALLGALKDPDADVRRQIVGALGCFGKTANSALPEVLHLVQHDPDENVRSWAIGAAAALDTEGTQTIPVLIQALADKGPEVRAAAARLLGGYGVRAKPAVAALTRGLADKEWRILPISADFSMNRAVRYDMAEALGEIGPAAASALPKLKSMFQSDKDGEVRAAAALAVLRIDGKDRDALPSLIALVGDDENGTGGPIEALEALKTLGPLATEAIPAIQKAARHEDMFVRMGAAEALAAIAGKKALPFLLGQIEWEKQNGEQLRAQPDTKDFFEDDQSRENLVEVLGTLGPEAAEAVPLLTKLLAEAGPYSFMRTNAIQSLGNIGPAAKIAVPHLIKALDDEDDNNRMWACEALGKIGPGATAAVPRLLQLSKSDPDRDMRKAAVSAIDLISK